MMVLKNIAVIISVLLVVLASSCNRNTDIDSKLKGPFRVADSLIYAGAKDSAIKILHGLRPDIGKNDPLLSTYYYLRAEYSRTKPALMSAYADSALSFFKKEKRQEQYPDEYYNALMVKGDAEYYNKHYHLAFDNYFKANNITLNKRCDHGTVASKIASVYFFQKNYKACARYLINSYNKLQACNENLTPNRYFFLLQGLLDNAGLAYERAGMQDSARYYYTLDIAAIEAAEKDHRIDTATVNASKLVVYDNLGGLNLKEGKIAKAESLLVACLKIPVRSKFPYITPIIKLANLHMVKGNYQKADSFFKLSRKMLDSIPQINAELEIRWLTLYAKRQEETGHYASANEAFKKGAQLKDSVDNSYTSLYKINVDRELDALQNKQQVAELKHKENLIWAYITCLILAIAMAIVIILLIYRNLKTARKHQALATEHNAQLQRTMEELEKANKNYIRIMRVMAHDLNNPLSGMTGLANILVNESGLSEENRHMLQMIEATGNHAMEMIKELLKTGLADENEAITTQPENLKEILNECIALLQFKAKDKQQEIIFATDEKPLVVDVNREKIWRVFNNLIGNAIKFTNKGGEIIIGIEQNKNTQEAIISVSDNGIGIPDAEKDKVFEMFTSAKRQGTGGEQPFGLGLSISKKIIEKHHGRIWFESKQDIGTTFFIALPYS